MKMNEFMTALQAKLDDLQPNYPNNAQSVLEVLCDTYNVLAPGENRHFEPGGNRQS